MEGGCEHARVPHPLGEEGEGLNPAPPHPHSRPNSAVFSPKVRSPVGPSPFWCQTCRFWGVFGEGGERPTVRAATGPAHPPQHGRAEGGDPKTSLGVQLGAWQPPPCMLRPPPKKIALPLTPDSLPSLRPQRAPKQHQGDKEVGEPSSPPPTPLSPPLPRGHPPQKNRIPLNHPSRSCRIAPPLTGNTAPPRCWGSARC